MNPEALGAQQPLRFALEGERVRKAVKVLEQESPRLAAALRRAVPFLGRRNIPVTLAYTRAVPIADLLAEVQRPIHATHFVITPGGAGGALLLDGGAIAMCLDGVLGGNGENLPVLNPERLTAPQRALIGSVTAGIVRTMSDALTGSLRIRLECHPVEVEEATSESAPIACVLEFGTGNNVGRSIVLLTKEALVASAGETQPRASGGDPRVAPALEDVEIVLVAELGRIQMRVGDVSRLKVGDILHPDVPVNGAVNVRADGHALLRGRPTTNGGRIALKIVGP